MVANDIGMAHIVMIDQSNVKLRELEYQNMWYVVLNRRFTVLIIDRDAIGRQGSRM